VLWRGVGERANAARSKGGRHDCPKLSAMQNDPLEEDLAAALEVPVLRVGVKQP